MQPLTYPVILENSYGASAYSSQTKLSKCGEKWVDGGNMRGANIIDMSGRVYRVRNVTKQRHLGVLPKWLVPYRRRVVQVEYDLEYVEKLGFEQLKQRMRDVFSNIGGEHDTGLVADIGTATTVQEIIETIGID